jgi:hypothetical protein
MKQLVLSLAGILLLAVNIEGQTNDKRVVPKVVLENTFGNALAPASRFSHYYLVGDFNGDRVNDLLAVVIVKGRYSDLPKDTKVSNPFWYGPGPQPPTNPTNRLALAVVTGGPSGLTGAGVGKFLLIGDSPVLILEERQLTATETGDTKEWMILIKRGQRSWFRSAPKIAKGDVVELGTEACESILYWNGRKFAWRESEGCE